MKSPEKTGGRIFFLAVVAGQWACSIPTDAPKLEQEWMVPVAETSMDVVELLPTGVGLTNDGEAFTVQIDAILFQETLGVLCEACQGLDGLTVPKPVFSGEFHESVALPEDVRSVQVREGRITVQAQNRFGFDPLKPPGGERGTFTLALHDGGPQGPVLDQIVVNGEDTSFGPLTTLSRDLDYSGSVGSTITVTVNVNSPAGGPEPGNWVPIRLNDEIRVTVTPGVLEAESASIDVAGNVFQFQSAALNVGGFDPSLVDHVTGGSIEMDIVNPWSVGAVLTLVIDGPTMEAPVVVIAPVPATPTSTVEVEFSQAEIQAFLGEPNVFLAGQGTVNPGTSPVTLAPGQTMSIHARLDLAILIG
jgi:hypothetical protein